MPAQRTKNKRPISEFESELLTALEFVRTALAHYPKATDRILTDMDVSDEAFLEDIKMIGNAIGFDIDDDGAIND
jgi:hypothetical protein